MKYLYAVRLFLLILPPERAHNLAMHTLHLLCKVPCFRRWLKKRHGVPLPSLRVRIGDMHVANPVGLAAGFDKDGRWINALACLGFGFVEVGTVTPKPQRGHKKPRIFRLKKEHSLINHLGFNNQGVEALYNRLSRTRRDIVVGVNIGKNRDTPYKDAIKDYVYCFRRLHAVADYFVVNVSSPNTPGLQLLQQRAPLKALLFALMTENKHCAAPKPIFLKISPDINQAAASVIVQVAKESNIQGLVISNTTQSRAGAAQYEGVAGGMSGRLLYARANKLLATIHKMAGTSLILIGVGGIAHEDHALEKLRLGASLVQLYTGFVYKGPLLVRDILRAISQKTTQSHVGSMTRHRIIS